MKKTTVFTRRNFIFGSAAAVLSGWGLLHSPAALGAGYLDKDVYIMQLYAITDEQKTFIENVVYLAQNKEISPEVVMACFSYARKKAEKHRRYYYFRTSLYKIFEDRGVDLDAKINAL